MGFWIQGLIISGAILIISFIIWSLSKPDLNMDSHDKIQTIAIVGLAIIAVTALIISISIKDSQNLITLAGVAVGGIAGFITQNQFNPPIPHYLLQETK